MGKTHTPSLAARKAIRDIGLGLRKARLRRRLPTAIVAERAFITLPTLAKVEKGDPGVSIGIYASVMTALGLVRSLSGIIADDPVGEALAEEQLPQRVRKRAGTPT